VLTLLEFVVRRQLTADGTQLAGLYAGNAKRETARPTAERLLDAFQNITVTIIQTAEQTIGHVTALNSVQQRILELLGFSAELYTALAAISLEPP
jgi:transposase